MKQLTVIVDPQREFIPAKDREKDKPYFIEVNSTQENLWVLNPHSLISKSFQPDLW